MNLIWRRVAFIAVVGVVVVASAFTYLALRPAHGDAARAGRTTPLALSCLGSGFCMAIDDQGHGLTYRHGAWSPPRTLQDNGLTSVSCSNPDFCVAVGVNGTAFVWRGSRWSAAVSIDRKSADQVDGFGTSSVNTVSCATPTFCMAGDVLGRVSIFDGSAWTRPRPIESPQLAHADRRAGTAGISSVSCTRARFCAAVTVRGRALTYDGTRWSSPAALEPAAVVNFDRIRRVPALGAVSCAAPTFCAAVDPAGAVFTYDGSTWSAPRPVDPQAQSDSNGMTSISCPTTRFCVAVDDSGHAFAYDGTTWSDASAVDPIVGLATVSCGDPTFCVALNDLGQAATFDGGSWTSPRDIDPEQPLRAATARATPPLARIQGG